MPGARLVAHVLEHIIELAPDAENSMTTQPDGQTVIVGVDTHKHVHVAVAIDTCGVPLDDAEAVVWYRLAAEQGLASAQHNLGLMYDNGEGIPQRLFGWDRYYSGNRFQLKT